MNVKLNTLFFIVAVTVSGSALAGSDDIQWISQCMMDNKNEGKTTEVVRKYCECMNEKMDDDETQSITQWEKTGAKKQKSVMLRRVGNRLLALF